MSSLRRTFISAFLLITLLFVASAHADTLDDTTHLRPLDRSTQQLMSIGLRDSPRFRELVERLNASDVVVYIRCGRNLRTGLKGQLTFVSASAGLRYVVVAIAPGTVLDRQVAMLGHELTHAVEIADTPSIVDSPSLGVAYEEMGRKRQIRLATVFDTKAAEEAGTRIWRELVNAPDQADSAE